MFRPAHVVCALAIVLVSVSSPAVRASPKLSPAAEAALASAEGLLADEEGDDRLLACIDALAFLEIVIRHAPDHGHAVRLYGECLFLTEQWADAAKQLERYIELVPVEARSGEVAEAVEEAEARLEICREKIGPVVVEPTPAPPRQPEPQPEPAPAAPAVATTPPPARRPAVRRAAPPPPPSKTELAARAGYSPMLGALGVGLEARFGSIGVSLGSGGYPLSAGLSLVRGAGESGFYVDLYGMWTGSGLFTPRRVSGFAVGGSVGYDLRPVKYLSIKVGIGLGYETAQIGPVLSWDACIGPVFEL